MPFIAFYGHNQTPSCSKNAATEREPYHPNQARSLHLTIGTPGCNVAVWTMDTPASVKRDIFKIVHFATGHRRLS